jgi:hypothetical protein
VAGIGFGFGQFALFSTYALAFWYGGQLVSKGENTFKEVMLVSPQQLWMRLCFVCMLGCVPACLCVCERWRSSARCCLHAWYLPDMMG